MIENAVAKSVIELRKQRGWTQEYLAKVSGVSPRTIQRLERASAHKNNQETLRAVASAFGVDVSRLRSGHDQATIAALVDGYTCRVCGSALVVRTTVPTEHDDIEQDVFECGAMDGYTVRPCPHDPSFPRFEDYEILYFEEGGEWHCMAIGQTVEARQVSLHGGSARSKGKALLRLKRAWVEARYGHGEAERQYPFESLLEDAESPA